MDTVSKKNFTRCIHGTFSAKISETQTVDLKLIEVTAKDVPEGQECFSLVFLSTHPTFLQQGIYPLSHNDLGELSIFIVPIGEDNLGIYYEAVFNLLKRATSHE